MKKHPKQTGTPKRVFKNLADISLFETELMADELRAIGFDFVDEPIPKSTSLQKQPFYDPKKKTYLRLDPSDPEQAKLIKDRSLVSFQAQLENDLKKVPAGLSKNPNAFYQVDIEPIIFEKKGKTAPSVPYLKVAVSSSFDDSEVAVHFVHNKAKSQQSK